MKVSDSFDLVVVGGGAAGFFGAINAAMINPSLKILLLEKSNKLLAKVRISGGGRCNVTHHCFEPTPLSKHYPRGQKELKKLFRTFQASNVVVWFDKRGIKLKTEADGRMFPVTDQSATIIDCFLTEAEKHNIQIEKNAEVIAVNRKSNGFLITTKGQQNFEAKQLLVAAGGYPKETSYHWLLQLGHSISQPLPSLFTFNDSGKQFKDLMGVSVGNAQVQIAGTKFKETGPVLLTHWGLSGPAVIKLSAWAADYLYQQHYNFTALVNWLGQTTEEALRQQLDSHKQQHPKQKVATKPFNELPHRLWTRLCELAEIEEEKIWGELSKRHTNKLIENLIRCEFRIKGKTTFKEEFVTCGGIKLDEIIMERMESKIVPGLFFAGEVLNIDGETGGFNFQSAWTTAFVAAKAIANSN
jgi:predicted Rossmann fold flavoprotein